MEFYNIGAKNVMSADGTETSFPSISRLQTCLLSSESQTFQWTTLSDQINNSAETEDTHNAEPSVEPTTRHNLKLPTELTQIPFSELNTAPPAKLSFVTARSFGSRKSLPGLTSDCSKPAEYALPEPEQSVKLSFTAQKLSKGRKIKRLKADKQLYEELLSLKQKTSNDKCKVLSNLEEKDTCAIETANLFSNGQPKMAHNETETVPKCRTKVQVQVKSRPPR
ncbi:uncharacterized protein DEA37_0003640 [Paragonimus westermani]|uniref:Uncharacterized protein n=1 Tax=Paragonimus westermani TaxID=34504 RepID=A0A5J4NPY0_9TREM|nr:uncharacterized protein DEA37_0003640 [Paragonimus westermani]